MSCASYEFSHFLIHRMKPIPDEDFIKECLVAVVGSICTEQRSAFEKVSLSSSLFIDAKRCRTTCTINSKPAAEASLPSPSFLTRAPTRKTWCSWLFSCVGPPLNSKVCEKFLQIVLCCSAPLDKTRHRASVCTAALPGLLIFVCMTTDGERAMIGERCAVSLLVATVKTPDTLNPSKKYTAVFARSTYTQILPSSLMTCLSTPPSPAALTTASSRI